VAVGRGCGKHGWPKPFSHLRTFGEHFSRSPIEHPNEIIRRLAGHFFHEQFSSVCLFDGQIGSDSPQLVIQEEVIVGIAVPYDHAV